MQIVVADPSAVALSRRRHAPRSWRAAPTEPRSWWLGRAPPGNSTDTVDETLHVISGEVFITNHGGAERRLGPGDMAPFAGRQL